MDTSYFNEQIQKKEDVAGRKEVKEEEAVTGSDQQ
jgi:hypothetical protein